MAQGIPKAKERSNLQQARPCTCSRDSRHLYTLLISGKNTDLIILHRPTGASPRSTLEFSVPISLKSKQASK